VAPGTAGGYKSTAGKKKWREIFYNGCTGEGEREYLFVTPLIYVCICILWRIVMYIVVHMVCIVMLYGVYCDAIWCVLWCVWCVLWCVYCVNCGVYGGVYCDVYGVYCGVYGVYCGVYDVNCGVYCVNCGVYCGVLYCDVYCGVLYFDVYGGVYCGVLYFDVYGGVYCGVLYCAIITCRNNVI